MSLRSPLGRVLGSGSAKDGTGHWWAQRVSAAGLLLLGAWFLWSLTELTDFAHAEVVAWIAQPWNSVMLLMLCCTLAWHSTLGVQVVIEDYVHGPMLKVIALLVNRFVHVFVTFVAVFAVMRISLGESP
ncbi:MAG: succinate dehydrogenase, hydrophobic membrane anchor protein [Gammaproteobacteria bacterium]|nr:succinate dehydrogenase, hydrophobic membrane anchor protein [Gammaproteobacteria bacterium]MDH4313537.1 succinate dehydrogenase, hydrophobic membrane anchor protein [Gammaproteobacteria bacterium]MDH5212606.1 succinate dehydrogenase, hydrophobic membrane anchor protein [Gammaproteobacteria bacterium]